MKSLRAVVLGAALLICVPPAAGGQEGPAGGGATEAGIPVTDEAVIESCSSCHSRDESGRMSRISSVRKTPEGWQLSLRRMMDLYGVRIDTATARRVVRYLSDHHGIAPAELRPGLFEVERVRVEEYEYPDDEVRETCAACHSMGRVITQRRTAEEWELLADTHRGLYFWVDWQTFRRSGTDEEGRHTVDRVNRHLAERFPLRTPEWSEWSANVRPPRLGGTWVLSGTEDGRGPIYGRMEITPVEGEAGAFTTRTDYVRVASGERVTRSGRAVVYTGYQWRGRSGEGESGRREVMLVERGWRTMHGRWFAGAYDEIGTEVELTRVGGGSVVAGVHPRALRSGVEDQEVRIYGANLPDDLSASDVDLGSGVRVTEIVERGADRARLRVDVAADAASGVRDVYVAGAGRPGTVVVYDRIHSVRVEPRAGMARVGGVAYPKEYEYFRAVGYHAGPDGESGTDDDLRLGRVPVEWSLAEYPVTYEDDDTGFVGSIEPSGRFVPAADGPNPERSRNRNNVGEVWVVATHRPEEDAGGADPSSEARTLRGRGYLLVTVPLYVRFEPWPSAEERPLAGEPGVEIEEQRPRRRE